MYGYDMARYTKISNDYLFQLRSIQFWAWAILGFPTHNIQFIVANCMCSMIGAVSFVMFKFYFLERYHLYGCRDNYMKGFPVICPFHRRPTGADLDSMLCLFIGLFFVVLSRLTTIYSMHCHWRCSLAQEIKQHVQEQMNKHKALTSQSKKISQIICRLESVPFQCRSNACPYHGRTSISRINVRRFWRYVSSQIFSEIFLCWYFRKWKCLSVIVFLLTATVLLPLAFFFGQEDSLKLAMGICLLVFYSMPISSLFMILLCIPLLMTNINTVSMMTLLIFLCWCALFLTCFIICRKTEFKDEMSLVKTRYKHLLSSTASHEQPLENDVVVCMTLYGYGMYRQIIVMILFDMTMHILSI